MDGRTDAHTDNMKTVYPPQTNSIPTTKFAGGIINPISPIPKFTLGII